MNIQQPLSSLQSAVNQQRFIVETHAFFDAYFQYDHHFLISEDDFIALEKMKDACTALELLLLEMPTSRTFSYEALSALFSSCTSPLSDILKRIKDVGKETDKIRLLASN